MLAGALLAVLLPIGDPVTITIGDPGNAADSSGEGAIAVPFRMATYEVTNAEYVEFLNAVAADDPNGLYDTLMTSSDRGGILRSGSPGSYSYSIKPDFDDKPANGFHWLSAARYCNWLHNGRPTGAQGPTTTESGAYDMSLDPGDIAREPGALWFLPTRGEWYKAAYFDPVDPGADASGTPDYWFYPTSSDALPALAAADASGDVTNPGANVANTDQGADWNGENGNVTTVGGCTSTSPWGMFDMGGNVNEMTETLGVPIPGDPPLPTRRVRGGDFSNTGALMGSPSALSGGLNMVANGANIGMRVAAAEPWFDLGLAKAGTHGDPVLSGSGIPAEGNTVTLSLVNALENTLTTLVVGPTNASTPFKGGTLVPSPELLLGGLPIDADGELIIDTTWPSGVPSQTTIFLQHWISDRNVPKKLAASNGLMITVP